MKKFFIIALALICLSSNVFADSNTEIQAKIIAQIHQLTQTWNSGNVSDFMKSYKDSDSTRYITTTITRGYKNILAKYKSRYPNREKMGKLSITDLDVTVLSPQYAIVVGKWYVKQKQKHVQGIFSSLYENTSDGWKIIVDHTS